jgi:hypothetical protein
MADAPDSKSGRGNPVWVQVPPPAPIKSTTSAACVAHHVQIVQKIQSFNPFILNPSRGTRRPRYESLALGYRSKPEIPADVFLWVFGSDEEAIPELFIREPASTRRS